MFSGHAGKVEAIRDATCDKYFFTKLLRFEKCPVRRQEQYKVILRVENKLMAEGIGSPRRITNDVYATKGR